MTTPSLDALQAYSAGHKAGIAGSVRALPLFQRAVAIDPDFALAHAAVGFQYSKMEIGARAAELAQGLPAAQSGQRRRALLHRNPTTATLRGTWNGQRRTLETWADSYPREASPHTLLAGLALLSTGQHELAIAETEKAIALDPDHTPAYANKAFNQLMLNRLDDALLTVRRAAERKLESEAGLLLTQYFVAFLIGNDEELRRTVTAARKSPATEDSISHIEVLALARSGRLQDARRMAAVAVQIAQKSGRRERAALFEAATAVWEAFYGNAAAARQSASRALELGRGGREVDYAAAFALALAGDVPQSRALGQELAREFPEDTRRAIHVSAGAAGPVLIEPSHS